VEVNLLGVPIMQGKFAALRGLQLNLVALEYDFAHASMCFNALVGH